MQLEGIHHITAITGDAPANVTFYTEVLGLRMVKKTVNQDDPTIYHLFYADEQGSPGSDLTFFEYPGAPRGRAGDGMVHRIGWRVASAEAIAFWADRLGSLVVARDDRSLRFTDPEGLEQELVVSDVPDHPLIADHPQVPADVALQGFDSVRAYASDPARSAAFLEQALGFDPRDAGGWEARGESRGGTYGYDRAPEARGLQGAGTVHHVAWASTMDDHEAWRQRVLDSGGNPTPVIDRFWFRSIYFREPSGVLFEIATLGPGFGVDEDLALLGEKLTLPPAYEHLRERLTGVLTPLPDTAAWRHLN